MVAEPATCIPHLALSVGSDAAGKTGSGWCTFKTTLDLKLAKVLLDELHA
jgi:hypothetical protein